RNPNPTITNVIRQIAPEIRIACTQLSSNCAAARRRTIAPTGSMSLAAGELRDECCAGNISIVLTRDGMELVPASHAHLAFMECDAHNGGIAARRILNLAQSMRQAPLRGCSRFGSPP